jgi:hypothetical protein
VVHGSTALGKQKEALEDEEDYMYIIMKAPILQTAEIEVKRKISVIFITARNAWLICRDIST